MCEKVHHSSSNQHYHLSKCMIFIILLKQQVLHMQSYFAIVNGLTGNTYDQDIRQRMHLIKIAILSVIEMSKTCKDLK